MLPTPVTAALLALLPAGGAPADTVPLYDDLGDHHHEISTGVAHAQRYFDQGLRLTFAFNHPEAIRAFEQAARLDPGCAMCWWGKAYAHGPNINAPMDSANGEAAHAAVRRALELSPNASEQERAYIEALAERYASPPPAERAALDSAYARAMGEVAARWPDDLDVAALHAEALMDLSPWNYWTKAGDPRPDTQRILAELDRALARDPNHPGACHYYIHAVEAARPDEAVPCAERLAGLMPGAGHLVHMPAHVYIRVGRYADAIASNEHAVHADETYIADQRPTMGVYVAGYYPHNYHFLAFASTMVGRVGQALRAARAVAEKTPADVARMAPVLEPLLAYHHQALVTFGRWQDVLDAPLPPPDLRVASGLAQYARGVAYAATGRADAAAAALDTVATLAAAAPEGDPRTLLRIAEHSLRGEIAQRGGDLEAAVEHFRAAADLEDGLTYIEPPLWYYPVRHSLGGALLAAGRPEEAEQAYREDLAHFPENGWALKGLEASLRAQGKDAEADDAERRFQAAWKSADPGTPGTRL